MAKRTRHLGTAIGFLAPNILGVLTFTVFPVLFSILLAFTNWDLRLHNPFRDEPLQYVGLDNFWRLVSDGDFFRYFGNTLFLMMGIPFAVAGSLFAAIILSKDTRGGGGKVFIGLIAATIMVVSLALLAAVGMGGTGMTIMLVGLACGILVMGMGGGVTIYRTLFYTPHFTAGVATFLLWKKLYNPQDGPINTALQPALEGLTGVVQQTPIAMFGIVRWALLGLMIALLYWSLGKLRRLWVDGDLAGRAVLIPVALLLLPTIIAQTWSQTTGRTGWIIAGLAIVVLGWQGIRARSTPRQFMPPSKDEGFGGALMLGLVAMVGQFILLGFSSVSFNLPTMAADGLTAPQWIASTAWAKPSLMIMGFWGAIGSNNMLLYLAALTNVPAELHEASDIDGASRFQKFWHVTWPQLAPTTFFILVMSTIAGLQGGFEMARTMTQGGPDGATTTLSYYIYIEGFETGRLSFAAATAWALFILVFGLTMFNWKFGNKYVND